MIFDSLRNFETYVSICPEFGKAFELLNQSSVRESKAGKYVFDPGRLFMSVEEYEGKKRSDGLWEAHRKFIDIQYIVKGAELMGRRDVWTLKSGEGYNQERDIEFFGGEEPGDFFTATEGTFAIFFPHDAHMPSLRTGDNGKRIKKIVFKAALPE